MLINLSSPANLAITEYKVMQNSGLSTLLPGMKLLINGELHIYYKTEGKTILPKLQFPTDGYLQIIDNVVKAVLSVRDNGFLRLNNLTADISQIYADQSSGEVCMTYIPSVRSIYPDEQTFASALRKELQKFMLEKGLARDTNTTQLIDSLVDSSIGWDELSYILDRAVKTSRKNSGVPNSGNSLVLVPVQENGAEENNELVITKDEFRIGRNSDLVDGVVKGSRLVGRIHCLIRKKGSDYFLVDLKSTNRTWLNREVLKPEEEYKLSAGDEITLANVLYKVVFR